MTRALPQASGLKIAGNLTSAKGIDLEFKPSVAIIAGSIDKLGLDIRSFRVPLRRALREVIIPSIRKNFDSGGRPKWAPLSDYTVTKKGNSRILIDSGKLRRTMGYQNIWTLTSNYLVLKDLPQSVWYGKVHQAGNQQVKVMKLAGTKRNVGGSFKVGSLPARPFVMLQTQDQKMIEMVFRRWLDERVRMATARIRVV